MYKVSIIIPVADCNNNLDECISHCLLLDYPDYEILVLPDNPLPQMDGMVKVFPIGGLLGKGLIYRWRGRYSDKIWGAAAIR